MPLLVASSFSTICVSRQVAMNKPSQAQTLSNSYLCSLPGCFCYGGFGSTITLSYGGFRTCIVCWLGLGFPASLAIIVSVPFLPAALLNKSDFAFQVCCDTKLYWKIPQHHTKGFAQVESQCLWGWVSRRERCRQRDMFKVRCGAGLTLASTGQTPMTN